MKMHSLFFRGLVLAFCFGTVSLSSCTQSEPKTQVSDNKVKEPQDTTLLGEYTCLPHRGVKPGEPTTQECAIGIKTADGRYYALNMAAFSQPMGYLHPGDKIRISGLLSDIRQGDEMYKYEADKSLAVTALEKDTHKKDGFLFSSDKAPTEIIVETPKPNDKIDIPVKVSGRVKDTWLSEGQWGPKGTMRIMLEDENGMQVGGESTVTKSGTADAYGFIRFSGQIKIGEHTQAQTGYVVIYQSRFSHRREYVRVPVRF
jgi:hypothetical protein